MSAHGRITGWVLGGLPVVVGLILFAISPAHMRILVDDPLGVYMVVAAFILEVVGVLAIRRIVNVEY
jgi:tight adherence protein B